MHVPVKLSGRNRSVTTYALLDCGASTIFLNRTFVERHQVTTIPLPRPVPLWNADDSVNAIGMVTHEAELTLSMGDHSEVIRAAIADIGRDDLIIGIDWLRHHNPSIDWQQGNLAFMRCPSDCGRAADVMELKEKSVKERSDRRAQVKSRRSRSIKDAGGSRQIGRAHV